MEENLEEKTQVANRAMREIEEVLKKHGARLNGYYGDAFILEFDGWKAEFWWYDHLPRGDNDSPKIALEK